MVDYSTEKILDKLQRINENKLRERILIPLLEKYGFDYIEVRHGVYEKGKDVLCVKSDELNEPDLLVVVLTREKLSGKAHKRGHPHGVLNQLSQCLKEPIKLRDGIERRANRIWLVTPYPLTASALESSFSAIVEGAVNRIRIVDGLKFISLLYNKAPELLAELGDRTTLYLKRVKENLVVIQEASAFHLSEKVPLLPIYTSLDVSLVLPNPISRVLSGELEPRKPRKLRLPVKDVKPFLDFGNRVSDVLGMNPIRLLKDRRGYRTVAEGRKRLNKSDAVATLKVNGRTFCKAIINRTKEKISFIKGPPNRSTELVATGLRNFQVFSRQLEFRSISEMKVVNTLLEKTPNSRAVVLEKERLQIGIEELLASRLNVQVVGDAGSGKTTLLRIIANKEASSRTGRLPVYVPLSAMSARDSLQGLIERSLANFGLPVSRGSLGQLLKSGQLLVLLDGIDEALSRVLRIGPQIIQFMSDFKSTQTIVSTRPWSAFRTRGIFITVELLPFTEEQVKLFFTKWFAGQPGEAREIIDHLDANPHLYRITSAPLIATVLAAVKSFGGKLPTSVLDLYEERLRLLLHDWDAIRGIKRDLFGVSDKVFFLRKLSWELHAKGTRTVTWDALLKTIRSYVGEIKSESEAEQFAQELVRHNNVLFQEPEGQWGLGHLQYQEYLAALEAKESPRRRLAGYLDNGWWCNVMTMYAELTRDIPQLIYDSLRIRTFRRNLRTLYALLQLAPNTEEKARGYVEKEWDIGNFDERDPLIRQLDVYTAVHLKREETKAS